MYMQLNDKEGSIIDLEGIYSITSDIESYPHTPTMFISYYKQAKEGVYTYRDRDNFLNDKKALKQALLFHNSLVQSNEGSCEVVEYSKSKRANVTTSYPTLKGDN